MHESERKQTFRADRKVITFNSFLLPPVEKSNNSLIHSITVKDIAAQYTRPFNPPRYG